MAGSRLETVTVVFTDVVGSTSWRVEVGGQTADERSVELERACRDVVASSGGTVVKTIGDAVMASFTGAIAALDAAFALQVLARRLAIGGLEGCMRVGISSGDMLREGADWIGAAAIEASRLCAEAAGGSVLVADATARLSRGRSGHELRLLGPRVLRGFVDPIDVYELVTDEGDGRRMPEAMTRAAVPALVGRRIEIVRAKEMLHEVAAGGSRTIFFVGEPGVGKTRLAAAVAADALGAGFTVLHGGCDEGMSLPYQPVVEAFGPWLAECPDAVLGRLIGPDGDVLVQLWPALAARLPQRSATTSETDAESRRWRLLEAVVGLVGSAAADRPLLLVVDDLQWAEPSTRLALGHIVRRTVPRTAIVATVRSTEAGHLPADLLGDLGVSRTIDIVELGGLDDEDVAELVAVRAGARPPDGLAEELRRTTDGNPFFLTALLAHLDAVAHVRSINGAWIEVDELGEAGMPDNVRSVIARRCSMLTGHERRALEIAAVVGLSFEERTVRGVMSSGPDETVEALDAAITVGLVRETGAGRFTFVHALTRQAVLDDLSRTGRARLHWRVAQELEREVIDRPRASVIAYHYEEGRHFADPAALARCSLAAADEAMDGAAFAEAAHHLQTALSALDQMVPDPELRYRALRLLGQALNALADHRAAEEAWLGAADIALALGDPERLFATVVGYGYVVRLHGDAELMRLLDGVLNLLGPGDSPLRASALGWRAVPLLPSEQSSRSQPNLETVEEAVAMARRTGDQSALATTLRSRLLLNSYSADAAAMLSDIQELLTLGPVGGVAITRDNAAVFREHTVAQLRLGRRTDAETSLQLAKLEAEHNGMRMSQGSALILESALARADGRFTEAKRFAAEAAQHAEPDNVVTQLVYSSQVIATRLEEGRLDSVIASLREFDRSGIVAPAWRAVLANALADGGHRDEATDHLGRLLDDEPSRFLNDTSVALAIRHLTEACRHLDDTARAATMLPYIEPWAGQLLVVTFGTSIEGASDRGIAHLLATLGRCDEADAAYTRAAELEHSAGFPPLVARSRYWHARLLLQRNVPGDQPRAIALLDNVIEITDQLAMQHLATQARACRNSAISRPSH